MKDEQIWEKLGRRPVNGTHFVAEEFPGGDDWMNRRQAQKCADMWNEKLFALRKAGTQ